MTALSKTVLEKMQVRKTHRQKSAFIAFLQAELGKDTVRVEKSGMFGSRNIVLGDVENAEMILAAHYDTQPVLPFPNFLTPKNIPAYIAYMLLLMSGLGVIGIVLGVLLAVLDVPAGAAVVIMYGVMFLLLALMLFGPANKHTANDNTSGVITVLEAYADEDIRRRAAFVLFDHEEMGLFGSAAFARAHRQTLINKPVINFDCVGDGDTVMVILSRRAKIYAGAMEKAFQPSAGKAVLITDASKTLYPSDQMNFPVSAGVAAFRRAPVIGYYLGRIHTPRDTVMEEENVRLIVESLHRLELQ